ncbi:maleylpyruvate isomerase family mycothiol-dependent enzyme, partial [Janibacter melonis]|nr:maleylpyruvate isomerase family mycothiol-dependent enzyme [Janibacter melonis]
MPQDPASRYDRRNTPLVRVVDAVPDDAWDAPSPCEGWSAADVLQHLVDTQRTFLLTNGASLPDPAPVVAQGPALAWRTHSEAVARVLADPRVGEAPYETPFLSLLHL